MATTRDVIINLGGKVAPSLKTALSRIQASMRRIRRSIGTAFNFGKRIAFASAVAVVGLGLLVRSSLNAGDALDKMAQRTGLSVKFLESLRLATKLGGTSLAVIETAVKKVTQAALDSNDGLETYTRLFDKLGVTVADQNGNLKSSERLFLETADAISKLENSTVRIAIATRLFGRAGTDLLPALTQGSRGLLSMIKRSKELGSVWTDSTTKAAANLNDSLAEVGVIAANLRDTFAIALTPALQEITENFVNWFIANKELVQSDVSKWAEELGEIIETSFEAVKTWAKDGTFFEWWRGAITLAREFETIVNTITNAIKLLQVPGKFFASLTAEAGAVATFGFKETREGFRKQAKELRGEARETLFDVVESGRASQKDLVATFQATAAARIQERSRQTQAARFKEGEAREGADPELQAAIARRDERRERFARERAGVTVEGFRQAEFPAEEGNANRSRIEMLRRSGVATAERAGQEIADAMLGVLAESSDTLISKVKQVLAQSQINAAGTIAIAQ